MASFPNPLVIGDDLFVALQYNLKVDVSIR